MHTSCRECAKRALPRKQVSLRKYIRNPSSVVHSESFNVILISSHHLHRKQSSDFCPALFLLCLFPPCVPMNVPPSLLLRLPLLSQSVAPCQVVHFPDFPLLTSQPRNISTPLSDLFLTSNTSYQLRSPVSMVLLQTNGHCLPWCSKLLIYTLMVCCGNDHESSDGASPLDPGHCRI